MSSTHKKIEQGIKTFLTTIRDLELEIKERERIYFNMIFMGTTKSSWDWNQRERKHLELSLKNHKKYLRNYQEIYKKLLC